MTGTPKPQAQPSEIGARVRKIRRRRGLTVETAARLAGVSKSYLSMLERGERRFERRGLLEDLAGALGCSVVDLTGTPYLPTDRASADALATLPGISVALYDTTLEDAPDVPARPVEELVRWARQANEFAADSRYSLAGRALGDLLTELHVQVITGNGDVRRAGLAALVEACFAACGTARSLGNPDLAVHAARRAYDAARELGDPGLVGFAAMIRSTALSRLGARHRAHMIVSQALQEITPAADPTGENTATAEACGMLHLSAAQLAAKDRRADDAATHLTLADELASRTGERNHLWFSFGPANVRAWSLSIAVELERGPATAERVEATDGYANSLVAADRRAAVHFDLARAYSQDGGSRDLNALRHLDAADRIAPQRIRHDPIARELLFELDMRARMRTWELNSLRNRFGVGSHIVNN
ncbi:MAG TPA: helix-turn-helix domain-containing protein [Pseudonocardiaceae bacterium]|nr:helix-turn-helix domain-containing protein [Pseudonocardiaceae bacterium]